MKLRCIIVEDEPMARKSLTRQCGKVPELELVGVCENGEEALKMLETEDIDLIFLDIEMPGLSGIELLEQAAVMPQVIFTTAKKEYAFEAFEYEVTDYLKKPIMFPRFQKAVYKALEIAGGSQVQEERVENLFVKVDGKYIQIKIDKINYIESVGDYVKIHSDIQTYVVHTTLKHVESRLAGSDFIKVHRSFIVNIHKIVDIAETTLVISQKVIPISRQKKPILISKLNLL